MRAMALVLLGCVVGFLIGCKGASSSAPGGKEGAAAKPKDMVVGTWEAVDAKDGKGGKITYTKEGGLIVEMPGAPKMEGKYKFLEDELMEVEIMPPPETKLPAMKQKMKMKVGKDEMTTTDEKGTVEKFKKKS